MKAVARFLALLSLVATLLPPLLFLFQLMTEGAMKATMLAATVAWFLSAPRWMKGGER